MLYFDPWYFLFLAPAIVLGMWAQWRVRSTYASASAVPARLTGAAAARHVLDSAGLGGVGIEQVPGVMTDHYDPREKVLRLSSAVYGGRSLAAVGIAAHEAGHALQDAHNYVPLVVRNAAVPVANFGSSFGVILIMIGAFLSKYLVLAGIALFAAVVFFQVVNLPVEFNASSRAKRELAGLGIVDESEMPHVNRVLNAAAMTYVAATLTAVLQLLYFLMRFTGRRE
jgi:Zn-dependent membrane protease YugP